MKEKYTCFAVPKMVALIALIALMPTILFGVFFAVMFSPYSLIVFAAIFIFIHTAKPRFLTNRAFYGINII